MINFNNKNKFFVNLWLNFCKSHILAHNKIFHLALKEILKHLHFVIQTIKSKKCQNFQKSDYTWGSGANCLFALFFQNTIQIWRITPESWHPKHSSSCSRLIQTKSYIGLKWWQTFTAFLEHFSCSRNLPASRVAPDTQIH